MKKLTWAALILSMSARLVWGDSTHLGIFSARTEIGAVARPGSVNFNAANGEYLVSGSGGNMWFTNDAFHFVWKEMSGDLSFAANIRFPGTNGNPHRKACLVIRQSLEPDSAYVDVALHGIGLTSLQYRETDGDTTHEIQSNLSGPARVGLEKHGDYFTMFVAPAGQKLHSAGAMYRIHFQEPFYVGLGVCSHDERALEQAVFSNVQLKTIPSEESDRALVDSALQVVGLDLMDRRVIYRTRDYIEAPNWSPDGKFLLFNSNGQIYRLPAGGGTPQLLDTGIQTSCNNDHGISPDGKQLAISDQTLDGKSRIYVLPLSGGAPRLVTELAPSYWHGWSPDGKTLAYCAERNGLFDVYTIPVEGGPETRLTTTRGLDDGPDYSPDGKYLYFNSERTGLMQIWRMKPDGSDQEQITFDDCNNWFAHPSPDGRWIVFLTYAREVKGHPARQNVMLRLMSLTDRKIRVLAKLYGGQGTINVPSWSPDSRSVAFISYQMAYQ